MRAGNARSLCFLGLGLSALAAAFTACGGGETGGGGSTSGNAPGTGAGTGPGPSATCAVAMTGIALSAGPGTAPAVATDGDRFLVVWSSTAKDAGDIHAIPVDAKGNPGAEQTIAEGPEKSELPAVVRAAGGGYLALWQDTGAAGAVVRARRLGDDGKAQGAAFEIAKSANLQARPTAAALPDSTALAWMDPTDAFVGLLHGAVLTGKNPLPQGSDPALATSGGTLGITWIAGQKLGFAAVTDPLGPLMPAFFREAAAGKPNVPRVAAVGDGAFDVVWEDSRGGDAKESIYLVRIGKDGKPGEETEVTTEPGGADYPDVAMFGSQTAIAYYQFREGPPVVYVALLSQDRKHKSPDLQISASKVASRYPRIAPAGKALGVAYAETGGPVRFGMVTCP